MKSSYEFDFRVSFSDAIKNWRHGNNIPLKQIAKDLGYALSTVSRIASN
jgi:transcriptional regulator with XRE-family HTH domain